MLISTKTLGCLGIQDPNSRADTATYWAPSRAKSFITTQVVAPYCKLDDDLKLLWTVRELWQVDYYSKVSEGTKLTGLPGQMPIQYQYKRSKYVVA